MKQILILVDTSRGAGREFLTGVENYLAAGAPWQVIVPPPKYIGLKDFNPIQWSHVQRPDGVLAFGYYTIEALRKLDACKVIMYHEADDDPRACYITANSRRVARMAFDYLAGLGHRRFAYCSCVDLNWSAIRKAVFEQTVRDRGFEFTAYHYTLTSQKQIEPERRAMGRWLRSLAKPIGIFACNDDIGLFVLESCKAAGVSVPDEVAVLGVDNDELICRLPSPSLSSIKLDFRGAGYRAAERLDGLMKGGPVGRTLQIDPRGIVARHSTDTLAVDDPVVRKALIYIREHFQSRIAVADVARHMAVSRNTLETRFKRCLNKTVADELCRLRVELIQDKLIHQNISINKIAGSLEFTSPEHFSRFFKNVTGLTPNQYRNRYRYL